MPRLIQLKTGSWICPGLIGAVRAVDNMDLPRGGYQPPCVAVTLLTGDREVIECPSLEAAQVMRDEIAAQVQVYCAQTARRASTNSRSGRAGTSHQERTA